jgi:hypothetical protein
MPFRIESIRACGANGLMITVGSAGLKDEAVREANLFGFRGQLRSDGGCSQKEQLEYASPGLPY